ncbi:hypothetical protein [Dapis sp. BLCC M172]|uniref:hypothetical protein n=1 Tax=Dapis sp. BLCC M172 TaxID=2975281 RepID=UPI003CE86A8C
MSVKYLAQERPARPAPAIATRICLVKTSSIKFTYFFIIITLQVVTKFSNT